MNAKDKANMKHSTIPPFYRIVLGLLLPLTIATSAACSHDDDPEDAAVVHVGDSLPAFSVRMMDGTWMSRDSLVGRRSVVVLFNTGCGDCRQELPVVDSLYVRHRADADVRFVAIARAEESESIWAFWDERELSMPFSPQPDRAVYQLFANSVIPRLFLSGPDAIVRFAHDDQAMPDLQQLELELAALR